jgi:hypothetical protein
MRSCTDTHKAARAARNAAAAVVAPLVHALDASLGIGGAEGDSYSGALRIKLEVETGDRSEEGSMAPMAALSISQQIASPEQNMVQGCCSYRCALVATRRVWHTCGAEASS